MLGQGGKEHADRTEPRQADEDVPAHQEEPPEADTVQAAVDAYLFGYPLVLMDVTRQVMTAVPKADAHNAPINQFVHAAEFPDDTFTQVVSPNADTLYSFAWLDLTTEPMLLSVPAMKGRYYVMQLLGAT